MKFALIFFQILTRGSIISHLAQFRGLGVTNFPDMFGYHQEKQPEQSLIRSCCLLPPEVDGLHWWQTEEPSVHHGSVSLQSPPPLHHPREGLCSSTRGKISPFSLLKKQLLAPVLLTCCCVGSSQLNLLLEMN